MTALGFAVHPSPLGAADGQGWALPAPVTRAGLALGPRDRADPNVPRGFGHRTPSTAGPEAAELRW